MVSLLTWGFELKFLHERVWWSKQTSKAFEKELTSC